eukprot:TCONS_00038063-protein
MREMRKAISKMNRKGAQGPNEIPPTFLKELSPKAQQEILTIFNMCLRDAACPRIWRIATILPLLKVKKPATELVSYFRHISLTSCVSKCFERIQRKSNQPSHKDQTRIRIQPEGIPLP